jgi:hypothetical protein
VQQKSRAGTLDGPHLQQNVCVRDGVHTWST